MTAAEFRMKYENDPFCNEKKAIKDLASVICTQLPMWELDRIECGERLYFCSSSIYKKDKNVPMEGEIILRNKAFPEEGIAIYFKFPLSLADHVRYYSKLTKHEITGTNPPNNAIEIRPTNFKILYARQNEKGKLVFQEETEYKFSETGNTDFTHLGQHIGAAYFCYYVESRFADLRNKYGISLVPYYRDDVNVNAGNSRLSRAPVFQHADSFIKKVFHKEGEPLYVKAPPEEEYEFYDPELS